MKRNRSISVIVLCTLMMLALILDSKTAAEGASEGIVLCLKTVIPSLLPMMVLSDIVTSRLNGRPIPVLKRLKLWCGIPSGAEGVFLAGLVGGYPIGAKCISQAYNAGTLSKEDAEHMLMFCSNAGPAFIFGICGMFFSSGYAPMFLWIIHIISAVLVAILCNGRKHIHVMQGKVLHSDLTNAVTNAVKTMSIVCGWIVLFRVIIRFLQVWLLWLFPPTVGVVLSGVLELTNGCCMLHQISDESLRFILCGVLLSFGGFCVIMQTAALSKGLSTIKYIKGKLLQGLLSFLLALPAGSLLFTASTKPGIILFYIFTLFILPVVLYYFKKTIAFHGEIIYNTAKP